MSIENVTYKQEGDKTVITITEGPHAGISYIYGRVWFPDEKEPVMSFDYDVVSEKKPELVESFQHYIGEILHQMLKKALSEESVIYTGGV